MLFMSIGKSRNSSYILPFLVSLGAGLLAADLSQAQTNSVWAAGTADWSIAGNWTPNGIPNNTGASFFNVFIDNDSGTDSVVSITTSSLIDVDSITIDSGDQLILTNNSNLEIVFDAGRVDSGKINNSGLLSINAGANATDLRVNGQLSLSGGGVVSMSGANARILDEGAFGIGHLINVDNTIQGQGNIGSNSTQITNQAGGLIDANVTGQKLTIDPANEGLANLGTMQASNGGLLELNPGDFDNTGGLIRALDGSKVLLTAGSSISGGTLSTSGSGEFNVVASETASLTGLTNQGKVRLLNGSNLDLNGTITNNNELIVDAGASAADLRIIGDVTLNGGGTVSLLNANSRIMDEGAAGIAHLINIDNTIQGQGNIGSNSTQITNQAGGLIDANVTGQKLTIDPANEGLANLGTMQASNGGLLELNPGDFDNTGGLIRALDGSKVLLTAGSSISGGTLSTSGSGEFNVVASETASLTGLTNQGKVRLLNGSNLDLNGTITNNNELIVDAGASAADLRIIGDVTLNGGGTVSLLNANSRIMDEGAAGIAHLINVDNTIQGQGSIGFNSTQITNQAGGTIHANVGGTTLTLNPEDSTTVVNDGAFRASAGGTLDLTSGNYSGNGTFEALDNGLVRFSTTSIVQNIDGSGNLTSGAWRSIDGGSGATVEINLATTAPIVAIGANAAVELSGANSSFTVAGVAFDISLSSNQGSFLMSSGRVMNTSTDFGNSGIVLLDGATTELVVGGGANAYTQTAGVTQLANNSSISADSFQFTGGELSGNGSLKGLTLADFDSGSTIAPGLSAGILGIDGDAEIGGAIDIQLGGLLVDGALQNAAFVNQGTDWTSTEFDQLHIFGNGTLEDGLVIDVSFISGFAPSTGDFFDILSGDSLSAVLANVFINAPAGYTFDKSLVNLFDPTASANRDVLRLTATAVIPEPSIWMVSLLGIGLIASIRARRDRRVN